MIVCGIDPGAKGGLCFMDSVTKEIIHICPMPMDDKELDYLEVLDLFNIYKPKRIVIERVWAIPAQGRKQGASSSFNFGRMYGGLKGLAYGHTYNVSTVTPKEWQKALFGLVKWDKQVGIDWCQKTYPSTSLVMPRCRKPHDGISDAICIAYYGCM